MLIISQHIFYPLTSVASIVWAYAGQGLVEAQDPKANKVEAITTTAILLIMFLI